VKHVVVIGLVLALAGAGWGRGQAGVEGQQVEVSTWEKEEIERQITLGLIFDSFMGDVCQINIYMQHRPILSGDEKAKFIKTYMTECVEEISYDRERGQITAQKTAISSQSQYLTRASRNLYTTSIVPIAQRRISTIHTTQAEGKTKRIYEITYMFEPCYPTLKKFPPKGPLIGHVECLVSTTNRTLRVEQFRFEDKGIKEFETTEGGGL